MVHYMPWYQTPSGSAAWGWHWTMDHFNPRETDENGRAAIASHYYPLTGPYDSGDVNLLEYQVMLMKIAGIDGVIVDWYGFKNFWDYGKINSGTRKLFNQVQAAGMKFAITWEDTTVRNMLENGAPDVDDRLVHGQEVMQYLQDNWFPSEAYLKFDGRPVLYVFGNPPYFRSSSDWETLFSGLEVQPLLVTQDGRLVPQAESGFPWPPMHLSFAGELSRESLAGYLDGFYAGAADWDFLTAAAFPGFQDIYAQAGVGSSYGYLDAEGGETLAFTLDKALAAGPDVIQLVTWNDYGEGTNIEPTVEYGYDYLEVIQQVRRDLAGGDFAYAPEDLEMPLEILALRQSRGRDPGVQSQLDNAVTAILAGRMDIAREIMAEIE